MDQKTQAIDALIVEPGKVPYLKKINADIPSFVNIVGDRIFLSLYPYFQEPVVILVPTKGKPNRALKDDDGHIRDVLMGTFMIVGKEDRKFTSIAPKYIERFKEKFRVPDAFEEIDGRLVVRQ